MRWGGAGRGGTLCGRDGLRVFGLDLGGQRTKRPGYNLTSLLAYELTTHRGRDHGGRPPSPVLEDPASEEHHTQRGAAWLGVG